MEQTETRLIPALKAAGATLAVAESCTGGLLAQRITSVSGASEVFCGGVVSYTEAVKQKLLGVKAETLAAHTVYSAPVALEMARGVAAALEADLGAGITGIAGPGGALPGLPVGTVFVAVCDRRTGLEKAEKLYFPNMSREQVRQAAADAALRMLLQILEP